RWSIYHPNLDVAAEICGRARSRWKLLIAATGRPHGRQNRLLFDAGIPRGPVMRRASAWNISALSMALLIVLGASFALAQQSSAVKGDVGAKFITVTPEIAKERDLLLSFGAMITEVIENGAAAKANIAVGDLIQSINDHPVLKAEDVQAVLDPLSPG